MKLRQMCGGGTWKREHLRRLRRPRPGVVVWDFAGWGIFPNSADVGPLRVRFHGRLRNRFRELLLSLVCKCEYYEIVTDYGTGREGDVATENCPIHRRRS
jgi:hypothetical protein